MDRSLPLSPSLPLSNAWWLPHKYGMGGEFKKEGRKGEGERGMREGGGRREGREWMRLL